MLPFAASDPQWLLCIDGQLLPVFLGVLIEQEEEQRVPIHGRGARPEWAIAQPLTAWLTVRGANGKFEKSSQRIDSRATVTGSTVRGRSFTFADGMLTIREVHAS